jgi:hypothetical protein
MRLALNAWVMDVNLRMLPVSPPSATATSSPCTQLQNFEAALVNGYFTPVPNSVAALLPGPPGANSSSNGSSSNATAGPVTLQGFNTSFGYAPSSVLLLPLAPVTSLLMPTNTADMSNPFAMFKPYVVDLPSRGRCYRLRFINANGEAAGLLEKGLPMMFAAAYETLK